MKKQELEKLGFKLESNEYFKDGMIYCKNCNSERLLFIDLESKAYKDLKKAGYKLKPIMRMNCTCQDEKEQLQEYKENKEKYIVGIIKNCLGEKYMHSSFEKAINKELEMKNDNMKKAYRGCYDFCENINKNKGKGVYLWGECGCGKTTLTACMLRKLLQNNVKCHITTVSDFQRDILEIYNSRVKENSYIKELLKKDVIFIDDLGTSKIKKQNELSFIYEKLDDYINIFYNNNKIIICSSNYNRDELLYYGVPKRCIERLYEIGKGNTYHFTNGSFRV